MAEDQSRDALGQNTDTPFDADLLSELLAGGRTELEAEASRGPGLEAFPQPDPEEPPGPELLAALSEPSTWEPASDSASEPEDEPLPSDASPAGELPLNEILPDDTAECLAPLVTATQDTVEESPGPALPAAQWEEPPDGAGPSAPAGELEPAAGEPAGPDEEAGGLLSMLLGQPLPDSQAAPAGEIENPVFDLEALPDESLRPPALALDDVVSRIDRKLEEATQAAAPAIAAESDRERTARKTTDYVVFLLAGTRYALPLTQVTEMEKVPRITRVPNTPEFMRGVTNMRGEILAVLDMRVLLGLPLPDQKQRERILVVRPGEEHAAALLVDGVRGIARVPAGRMSRPAGPIDDKVLPLLQGVTEHEEQLLNVLSLERLFQSRDLQQFGSD